jgi:hypothetical protein
MPKTKLMNQHLGLCPYGPVPVPLCQRLGLCHWACATGPVPLGLCLWACAPSSSSVALSPELRRGIRVGPLFPCAAVRGARAKHSGGGAAGQKEESEKC